MKYSNSVMKYALLPMLLALSACGVLPEKKSVERQDRVEQQSTAVTASGTGSARYLPVLQQDRKGRALPYVAQPNPYASLPGTITAASTADFAAAKSAFRQKNYSLAESKLNGITERESGLSGPWVMLGDIAKAKKEFTEAESFYRKALEVNKQNVNAYLRLAKVQRMLGNFENAKATYIAALSVWRDFPEAHLNIGILYDLYLNDPVQAQRHIEAYQFLSGGGDERVAQWLEEIRLRSGAAPQLTVGN